MSKAIVHADGEEWVYRNKGDRPYVYTKLPTDHWLIPSRPLTRSGKPMRIIAKHRVVMSEMLGRPLRKGESVHHRDGDGINNDPSNLELWIVPQRFGQRVTEATHCPGCQCDGL